MQRDGRTGFTLIELLVVIAIIAILAAILFPVFISVRDKGRQAACLNNQKQIGMALMQYVSDNNDTFPVVDMYVAFGPNGDFSTNASEWGVFYVLQRYLKNKGILKCPSAIPHWYYAAGFGTRYKSRIGYIINGDPQPQFGIAPLCGSKYGFVKKACKAGQIRNPTRVIATQDRRFYTPGGDMIPGFHGGWDHPTHIGGLTFTFADGHAGWIKTEGDPFFTEQAWRSTYAPAKVSWDYRYQP